MDDFDYYACAALKGMLARQPANTPVYSCVDVALKLAEYALSQKKKKLEAQENIISEESDEEFTCKIHGRIDSPDCPRC